MIVVYKFNGNQYSSVAVIDEEKAVVIGSSSLADYFRYAFNKLEAKGHDPKANMDEIKQRIYDNYRNGYYWAE
jgi:hypothetical protein